MMSAALPPSRDHALPPRGGESPARRAQQAAGGVSRLAAMQVTSLPSLPAKKTKAMYIQTYFKIRRSFWPFKAFQGAISKEFMRVKSSFEGSTILCTLCGGCRMKTDLHCVTVTCACLVTFLSQLCFYIFTQTPSSPPSLLGVLGSYVWIERIQQI